MTRLIEVNKTEDINPLLDCLHDRFYQLSTIEHRVEERSLYILTSVVEEEPILKSRGIIKNKWSFNVYKAVLVIGNVIGYTLDDKAEIDEADINTIEYKDNEIIINGSVPVSLKVQVASLCMKLEIHDEPFKTEQRTTYKFFGIESSAS